MIRNPMSYTLGQAAKETGKTKPTILRAIKNGKISAKKDDSGRWQIEPVELHRIYPSIKQDNSRNVNSNVTTQRYVTPDETAALQAELSGMKAQVALLTNERDDLRRRLDAESEERRKLTLMLTHEQEKPSVKVGWFDRLLGRA